MTAKRTWEGGCQCQVCLQMDPTKTLTDEEFDRWLKAHPLDPIEQEKIEGSVHRLKKRFREKPGPELNL